MAGETERSHIPFTFKADAMLQQPDLAAPLDDDANKALASEVRIGAFQGNVKDFALETQQFFDGNPGQPLPETRDEKGLTKLDKLKRIHLFLNKRIANLELQIDGNAGAPGVAALEQQVDDFNATAFLVAELIREAEKRKQATGPAAAEAEEEKKPTTQVVVEKKDTIDVTNWPEEEQPEQLVKVRQLHEQLIAAKTANNQAEIDVVIPQLKAALTDLNDLVLDIDNGVLAHIINRKQVARFITTTYVKPAEDLVTDVKNKIDSDKKDALRLRVEAAKKIAPNIARLETVTKVPIDNTVDNTLKITTTHTLLEAVKADVAAVPDADVKAELQKILDAAQEHLNKLLDAQLEWFVTVKLPTNPDVVRLNNLVARAATATQGEARTLAERIEAAVKAVEAVTITPISIGTVTIFPNLPAQATLYKELLDRHHLNAARAEQARLEKDAATFEKSVPGQKRVEILRLFKERGVPERKEGEPIHEYLSRIHNGLARIAVSTILNDENDSSPNGHTSSQKTSPMYGPLRKVDLFNYPLTRYTPVGVTVKDLGAIFDDLPELFDTVADRAAAEKFRDRQKLFYQQVTIWHDRAVIRRDNENPEGPNGALAAYEAIKKLGKTPDMAPLLRNREKVGSEQAMALAVEFCVGVWSALSLKKHEKTQLSPLMSARVRTFMNNKDLVGLVPPYRSDSDKRGKVLKLMVAEAEKIIQEAEGIPVGSRLAEHSREAEARLAYHIGESYRVGSGIQAQLDATTKKDSAGNVIGWTVIAAEGEPKALNIGMYVESAEGNPARPDFVGVYKDYMVHGYVPFARALQYSHNLTDATGAMVDIGGFGDGRASLAQLLVVDGIAEKIDWDTASSDPDAVVNNGATQAIKFIWPGASVAKASSSEQAWHILPKDIKPMPTQMIGRYEDEAMLRSYFGFSDRVTRNVLKGIRALFSTTRIRDYEVQAFDVDSETFSQETQNRVKTADKDKRDYWLNAFSQDKGQMPGDFARNLRFLFSRDDKDATHGYVNDKIEALIEGCRAELNAATRATEAAKAPTATAAEREAASKLRKEVSDKIYARMQGYMSYDLYMRATFYLMQSDLRGIKLNVPLPDTRDVDDPIEANRKIKEFIDTYWRKPENIREHYDELNYHNWEKSSIKNLAGGPLATAPVLGFLINQSIVLRDLVPTETDAMLRAGYGLYRVYDGPKNANPATEIFTWPEVLKLAQEFRLGEGYQAEVVDTPDGREYRPRPVGKEITLQDLINRIGLLQYIFRERK